MIASTPPFCLRVKKVAWLLSGWRCTYPGWEPYAGASPPPHGPGTQRGGWAEPAAAVDGATLLCRKQNQTVSSCSHVPLCFVLEGVPVSGALCLPMGRNRKQIVPFTPPFPPSSLEFHKGIEAVYNKAHIRKLKTHQRERRNKITRPSGPTPLQQRDATVATVARELPGSQGVTRWTVGTLVLLSTGQSKRRLRQINFGWLGTQKENTSQEM